MPATVEGTVSLEVYLEVGRVKSDGDLSVAILSFNYEMDGEKGSYAGAVSQSVTDDTMNYVYLDNTGTLQINTTGFPVNTLIRLARVKTLSGVITNIYDERVLLSGQLDKEITFGKSAGESSTTSETWQQKLRVTTAALPLGDYLIEWYCEIKHSNATQSEFIEVRVDINDTAEQGFSAWAFPAWDDFSGMAFAEGVSGVQNIDLDYRRQGGGTAYLRRARILLRRIQ